MAEAHIQTLQSEKAGITHELSIAQKQLKNLYKQTRMAHLAAKRPRTRDRSPRGITPSQLRPPPPTPSQHSSAVAAAAPSGGTAVLCSKANGVAPESGPDAVRRVKSTAQTQPEAQQAQAQAPSQGQSLPQLQARTKAPSSQITSSRRPPSRMPSSQIPTWSHSSADGTSSGAGAYDSLATDAEQKEIDNPRKGRTALRTGRRNELQGAGTGTVWSDARKQVDEARRQGQTSAPPSPFGGLEVVIDGSPENSSASEGFASDGSASDGSDAIADELEAGESSEDNADKENRENRRPTGRLMRAVALRRSSGTKTGSTAGAAAAAAKVLPPLAIGSRRSSGGSGGSASKKIMNKTSGAGTRPRRGLVGEASKVSKAVPKSSLKSLSLKKTAIR